MKELFLIVSMLLYAGMCVAVFPEAGSVDMYHLISEITVVVILGIILFSIKSVENASKEAYGNFLIGISSLLLATITETVGIVSQLPFWVKTVLGEFTVITGFLWFLLGVRSWLRCESELKERLYSLSTQDDLTGLMNRRAFLEQAEIELQRAKRYKSDLALAMLDIDHFKSINDVYGHLAGDEVLKKLAKTIKMQLRKTEYVARWGGEEFILLMPESNQKNAGVAAERLRQKIEDSGCEIKGKRPGFTVSIGVTMMNEDDESLNQMVERADKALYQAKKTGRNKVCIESAM